MISVAGLDALRITATLTHSLPGLRARVSGPDGPLLEVLTADRRTEGWGLLACSPCRFRAAVGGAIERRARGERLSFLGLPENDDPSIELVPPRGGAVRSGGRYRVPVEGRWWWAFASTIELGRAHELGQELANEWRDLAPDDQLRLRWDPITQVTMAYVETTAAPGSRHEDDIVELLDATLARWAVDLLLAPQHPAPVEI